VSGRGAFPLMAANGRPTNSGDSEFVRSSHNTSYYTSPTAMGSVWKWLPSEAVARQSMEKKVVPMFHVPDVRRTVDWYRDLGFDVTVTYDDGADGLSFAMVRFGAGEVMFNSGGRLSAHHRREVDLYAYIDDVDHFYGRIKDRVEIVEGPHNMFYGMREVIVRDLNGFWITFGQQVPSEVLTPWPAVDSKLLQPYAGKYKSEAGLRVLITVHEGRLLAFPDDGPGVFLMPTDERTFRPMMTEQASVAFEGVAGQSAPALMFEQAGKSMRFVREP
jgi:catechol 2,3-dioxygenase-like lactoylglutathione lyase family enzyme